MSANPAGQDPVKTGSTRATADAAAPGADAAAPAPPDRATSDSAPPDPNPGPSQTSTATSPAQWLTVLTTTDAAEKAQALARGAVEARAAACAQIAGPVTSVYRWKGALETAQEWQVLFKTTEGRYPELERWLVAAHDYENPEIIATPVVRGSLAYLDWLEQETAG